MKKAMSKLFGKMAGKAPAVPPKASPDMMKTLAAMLKKKKQAANTKHQPIDMLK